LGPFNNAGHFSNDDLAKRKKKKQRENEKRGKGGGGGGKKRIVSVRPEIMAHVATGRGGKKGKWGRKKKREGKKRKG